MLWAATFTSCGSMLLSSFATEVSLSDLPFSSSARREPCRFVSEKADRADFEFLGVATHLDARSTLWHFWSSALHSSTNLAARMVDSPTRNGFGADVSSTPSSALAASAGTRSDPSLQLFGDRSRRLRLPFPLERFAGESCKFQEESVGSTLPTSAPTLTSSRRRGSPGRAGSGLSSLSLSSVDASLHFVLDFLRSNQSVADRG